MPNYVSYTHTITRNVEEILCDEIMFMFMRRIDMNKTYESRLIPIYYHILYRVYSK